MLIPVPSIIAVENFHYHSFKIIFESLEDIKNSDNEYLKDTFLILGYDQLFEDLQFFHLHIYNCGFFTNELIFNYFIAWRYNVYLNRSIPQEYFAYEAVILQRFISKHLYRSSASEICELLDWGIKNTQECFIQYQSHLHQQQTQESLTQFLLKGEKQNIIELITQDIDQFNLLRFYDQNVARSMHQIGYLWEKNEIGVAKEHLATSTMTDALHQITSMAKATSKHVVSSQKKVVLSCIGDEKHVMALDVIGFMLESLGYRVFKFGSSLNTKDLLEGIYSLKPSLVVFSLTLASNLRTLQSIIDHLKGDSRLFDGKIAVGGQAVLTYQTSLKLEGVDYQGNNLENFRKFCVENIL